jgi:hypothetical protein
MFKSKRVIIIANKKGVKKMGNLIRRAVFKQKQFYIYELMKTGLFLDSDSLAQWTVSELRREYEQSIAQRKKKRRAYLESASS